MSTTSYWETRKDIGIKSVIENIQGPTHNDFEGFNDEETRIAEELLTVLGESRTSYYFRKICRFYYKCTYKKNVCDCFKVPRMREIILTHTEDTTLNKLRMIEASELVAIEEHESELRIFHDFERGESGDSISLEIDLAKTLKKISFRCGRSCTKNSYRVLFARRKLDWQNSRISMGRRDIIERPA